MPYMTMLVSMRMRKFRNVDISLRAGLPSVSDLLFSATLLGWSSDHSVLFMLSLIGVKLFQSQTVTINIQENASSLWHWKSHEYMQLFCVFYYFFFCTYSSSENTKALADILHRFKYVNSGLVYVTTLDVEQSFGFRLRQ